MKSPTNLRAVPSVEKVLQALGEKDLPRAVVVEVIRKELGAMRRATRVPEFPGVLSAARLALDRLRRRRIQIVINGTGILIHTNLGRAPLGLAVQRTLDALAGNYNNLEFDLEAGERGERAGYLESNLALLCGAEAATVVNNCAAALILVLRHLTVAPRNEVIISRGELVQIGGGFRVPDILEASGARLREVGTTNKTSIGDYARAIRKETAVILKVHRSNFVMTGFVASPTTEELAALARRKRVRLIEDLGSGAMLATEQIAAIPHEPTPAESLRAGVDLVCCSGDKLFGGPQAGLIAGKARLIAALKRDPFFRAMRCDKLRLGALQTTVDLYLNGQAVEEIPVLALLRISNENMRHRAKRIIAQLAGTPFALSIGKGQSQMGGGALPRSTIESVTLDVRPNGIPVGALAARLRAGTPPVVGYVSDGLLKIDLRTVFARQDGELVRALREVAHERPMENAAANS
ncbi:MAG: L-seryl-tRNA(Ser) seleniumtransferase [Verrucomicrobiota bacterium]|jgi:L-seryl-tRNA(Ser) seleniumtransferase